LTRVGEETVAVSGVIDRVPHVVPVLAVFDGEDGDGVTHSGRNRGGVAVGPKKIVVDAVTFPARAKVFRGLPLGGAARLTLMGETWFEAG
jgi:hypothetical protein